MDPEALLGEVSRLRGEVARLEARVEELDRLANMDSLVPVANRRGLIALYLFLVVFLVTLFAEFIANDRPLLVKYDGHYYVPVLATYPETAFGGEFETAADYRDPFLKNLIAEKGGTVLWPPIRYSYNTHNLDLPTPAPSPPTWLLSEEQ